MSPKNGHMCVKCHALYTHLQMHIFIWQSATSSFQVFIGSFLVTECLSESTVEHEYVPHTFLLLAAYCRMCNSLVALTFTTQLWYLAWYKTSDLISLWTLSKCTDNYVITNLFVFLSWQLGFHSWQLWLEHEKYVLSLSNELNFFGRIAATHTYICLPKPNHWITV